MASSSHTKQLNSNTSIRLTKHVQCVIFVLYRGTEAYQAYTFKDRAPQVKLNSEIVTQFYNIFKGIFEDT